MFLEMDDPNSLRHEWVSGPKGRGTLDIIWTCLVTMFLGSWSALFLNLPGENSDKSIFLANKGRWMIVILLFPEMITALAAEQWRSARQSVEDFAKMKQKWEHPADNTSPSYPVASTEHIQMNIGRLQESPWTMRHAFFVDMGGVLLACPDHAAFPVTAYQLRKLIKRGYILYPGISQKEIWDKNKADGFARLLTIIQIIWFFVQTIGRAAQHLAITTLELSTLSFMFCTINTLYFWTHKPLDVDTPIRLECAIPLRQILSDRNQTLDDSTSHAPLDFMNRPISRTSLITPFWVGFEITFVGQRREGETGTRTANGTRVPNTRTIPPRGLIKRDILYALIFVFSYFGIHLAAWRFQFPTEVEQILWRASTYILLGLSGVYFLVVVLANFLAEPFAKHILKITEFQNPIELAYSLPRWAAIMIHIPFFFIYAVARVYIVVEGFYNLRALSKTAYDTVEWENFLPHFS